MEKVILKKSAWLYGGQVFAKVTSFLYTLFLARSLGVGDFGLYVAALSYFSLVSSLADFGITRFITREVSLGRERVGKLLSAAIVLRLIILVVFIFAFLGGIYFLDPDLTRRNLFLLAVLVALPQSISLTLDAAFIASLKTKYSALGIASLSIFTVLIGIILVTLGFGPQGAVLGLLAGQALYVLSLIVLAFKERLNWLEAFDFQLIKRMLAGSLPYGFLGILGLIYFKVDTLFLSYLRGNFETGIYGVAYRFLEAIVFIPTTLAVTLFPILAKLQEIDKAQIKKIYYKSIKVMAVFGVIVAVGYVFILPLIISLFLPQYLKAVVVVQILALSIPFMFVHVPVSQILLSSEKFLRQVIFISFVPLIFNITANLIFIPQYGFMAAAWITVISDVISLSVLIFYIQKYYFGHD